MPAKSPYNWQSHSPRIQIPRAGVGRVADLLRENGSAVIMGGRGMGKSIFLDQLKPELERDPQTAVLLVNAHAMTSRSSQDRSPTAGSTLR